MNRDDADIRRVSVPLRSKVPSGLAAELSRRIHFVSGEVLDFKLIERDAFVTDVELACSASCDPRELGEKLNRMIDSEVTGLTLPPANRFWVSGSDRAADSGVYAELLVSGDVAELGEGQIAVSETVIALMYQLDALITGMVKSMFRAREFRYPTLIPAGVLRDCGYFGSFPQYLMFVTRLHNDIEIYQEFARRYRDKDLDLAVLGKCGNLDYCLPPTMCFHTFGQFRGRRLPASGTTITARGKSFRFESRYARSLERLWDFTIREIVFLGSKDYVIDARRDFMSATQSLIEDLGLSGYCEVANDPFFAGSDATDRVWSQRLMELKYELQLHVMGAATIAVGSFNYHGDFFANAFGIGSYGEEPMFSGCVGFGLERLAYAFLCQYGSNPQGWPARVATGLAPAEPARAK